MGLKGWEPVRAGGIMLGEENAWVLATCCVTCSSLQLGSAPLQIGLLFRLLVSLAQQWWSQGMRRIEQA